MKFEKGKPRPPKAGRKKGSQNKFTIEIKDMIYNALHKAGGEKYLIKQSKENPNAFMALVGKVIPMKLTHGNDPDSPMPAAQSFTSETYNFATAEEAAAAYIAILRKHR